MKKLLCLALLISAGSIYAGNISASNKPTGNKSGNNSKDIYKKTWIDFNAGTLVEDEEPQAVLERFIGKVLATAGGERLKHEETGFKEIAIFKTGVTL